MKTLITLAIMTSALITSACGSDSKKKDNASHVFHSNLGNGLCLEVVQEELAARGYAVQDGAVAGACPATTLVQGVSASRYAACPFVDEDGVPATAVIYSKIYSEDDASLLDMTKQSPQTVCSIFVDGLGS